MIFTAEQLEMFPEPERQMETFEPTAEPEEPKECKRRVKLVALDDPARPRNRNKDKHHL